jgi:hypothetical protein
VAPFAQVSGHCAVATLQVPPQRLCPVTTCPPVQVCVQGEKSEELCPAVLKPQDAEIKLVFLLPCKFVKSKLSSGDVGVCEFFKGKIKIKKHKLKKMYGKYLAIFLILVLVYIIYYIFGFSQREIFSSIRFFMELRPLS